MTARQLTYTLRMNVSNLIRDISNIWFSIRLTYYAWKYKGGANIPPEIVGKLLGSTEDQRALEAEMKLNRAMEELCELFNLPLQETEIFTKFSLLLHGKLEKVEDNDDFTVMLNAPYTREVVFGSMIKYGDITTKDTDHMKRSNEWERFQKWLREKPIAKKGE